MDAICFGFSNFGQLSDEKFTSLQNLLTISPDRGIKYVSFSWCKCHIVLDDGTLTIRGFVDKQMFQTKTLMLPFHTEVKKFTSSGEYELCLTADGKCWKYVYNNWENITKYWNVIDRESANKELKIIDICSSDTLHLALSDSGVIFNIPIQIETPPKIKITKISSGSEHSLGLTENGSIFTWGNGSRGQLGNGSLNLVETPELLSALDGIVVVDIDAGGWHSAAVTESGDIYTWGWNNYGQLGLRTTKDLLRKSGDTYTVLALPKFIDYPNSDNVHVKQVSCGTQHTMILLENGLVYGCGWNKYGQVDPHTDAEYFDQMQAVPVPQQVDKIHKIFCESWNSVIYVTYKNRPSDKYGQTRRNEPTYEAESTTKIGQKYREDPIYEPDQTHLREPKTKPEPFYHADLTRQREPKKEPEPIYETNRTRQRELDQTCQKKPKKETESTYGNEPLKTHPIFETDPARQKEPKKDTGHIHEDESTYGNEPLKTHPIFETDLTRQREPKKETGHIHEDESTYGNEPLKTHPIFETDLSRQREPKKETGTIYETNRNRQKEPIKEPDQTRQKEPKKGTQHAHEDELTFENEPLDFEAFFQD